MKFKEVEFELGIEDIKKKFKTIGDIKKYYKQNNIKPFLLPKVK